jgi:hypothetical protein
MSFLQDIFSYWQNNTTLTASIPYATVFTGLAPAETPFPYVVITPVSSTPTFTTGNNYIEDFMFQISIFDVDLDNVEALALVVMSQFDWKAISGNPTISCMRQNYLTVADPDTPKLVYHGMIQYTLAKNRVLGT